jgi:hypothetical protein
MKSRIRFQSGVTKSLALSFAAVLDFIAIAGLNPAMRRQIPARDLFLCARAR